MSEYVSEGKARAARTAIQASPAWLITEGIDAFVYDMTDRQYGALVGLLTLVISQIMVVVENYTGRAVLRDVEIPVVPRIS